MAAILITGATGKQGGSLIKNLVSREAPFEILAVTRNTTSGSAQRLARLSSNIRLVEGNLDDPAGIFKNARSLTKDPIWGVFSVQVNHTHYPKPDEPVADKICRSQSATAHPKNIKAKP